MSSELDFFGVGTRWSTRQQDRRIRRWRRRQARLARKHPPKPCRLGEAGTARGSSIEVGSEDGGWVTPPPVQLTDGNVVRLYKDGQGLSAAFESIQQAKRQICLEFYIFHSDETGRAFAELLCEKARQGLDVFLIYDSFGSMQSDPGMFAKMRRAGVKVAEFHPIRPWDAKYAWRPFNRDHRKLIVVDNERVGLGGLNIGLEYGSGFLAPKARKCDLWRDNGIGIVGPGARAFAECFARTWSYIQQGGPLRRVEMTSNLQLGPRRRRRGAQREQYWLSPRGRQEVPKVVPVPASATAAELIELPAGEVSPTPRIQSDLGLLASAPSAHSPLAPFLRELVRSAIYSLDLTIAYFAPSDDLIAELCRAAQRGVNVRLMLPGKTDIPPVRAAAHAFYELLMSQGVEIWERQLAVLHAKTLCVDERISVVGSTNLDYRSIEFNCELSVVIRSKEFGRQLTRLFQHDMQFARQITLAEWRRRPWRDRFVQWGVSRARYLL
jgi:cardiolipin synthase